MKHLLDDVATFHKACDVPVLLRPAFPPPERIQLRLDLIQEERFELFEAVQAHDLTKVADELGDIIYVVVGTALEFGIPLDKVWDAIQKSNMAKADPATGKVLKRADGKILKPEGWQPPDIKGVLEQA